MTLLINFLTSSSKLRICGNSRPHAPLDPAFYNHWRFTANGIVVELFESYKQVTKFRSMPGDSRFLINTLHGSSVKDLIQVFWSAQEIPLLNTLNPLISFDALAIFASRVLMISKFKYHPWQFYVSLVVISWVASRWCSCKPETQELQCHFLLDSDH